MREETPEQAGRLRTGWTTGACATAAAVAAARHIFTGQAPDKVHLWLPKNREVDLQVHDCRLTEDGAEAGLIKDAGDDPDATHGARVWVRLGKCAAPGVVFRAGSGVGTVTRAGLALAIGEPAINPVPRRMLREHLDRTARAHGYAGGFEVIVGVDDGEVIAEKTMNARLGILGGLSILGTTGVVRPFSCASYIASIQQAIDVARANGISHVAACTGATSERTTNAEYDLPDMALIEMGDFVGAVLKHLRRYPIARVTLVGGFGKFCKLATGRLDLHSRKGGVDMDFLAQLAADGGPALQDAIRASNTSIEALTWCEQAGIDLAPRIATRAWRVAARYLPRGSALELWAIDKSGVIKARAGTLERPVSEIIG